MPRLLSVGHVCLDAAPGGNVVGGSVAYGSLTARRLGWEVGILTSAGEDFDPARELPGVPMFIQPSRETTRFVNEYEANGTRHQTVTARADDIRFDALPADWRAPDALLLGADNGLRGYPLRYQSGTRRALFTVEERFYTDLYVWQLFRVGGAAFLDIGRAWGGDNVNALNPGWLRNVGVGLRVVSVRSAFSNVLHVDLAFPVDATADIKKVQLNVKTKASF